MNDFTDIIISGTIKSLYYGYNKFDKDHERIYGALELDDAPKAAKEIKKVVKFKKGFTPAFIEDPEENNILNFKSGFDFQLIVDGEKTTVQTWLKANGNITGSKVRLSLRLKESGFYPNAIKVDELNHIEAKDFFADDDELPFN